MSYVLETTPLNRIRCRDSVLLLGEWCKKDSDADEVEVVDYHWCDRQKLQGDYELSFVLFEKFLGLLSGRLNELHGTTWPISYWRKVVGPWLYLFICVVIDRYQSLLKAREDYNIDCTIVPRYEPWDWIPLDYEHFNALFVKDNWNYYLFSEIVQFTGLVPARPNEFLLKRDEQRGGRRHSWAHRIGKQLLFWLSSRVPLRRRKVLFVEVAMPHRKVMKLLFRLGEYPMSYYIRTRERFRPLRKDIRRQALPLDGDCDEFDRLLSYLIPRNIPNVHLEGYESLVCRSKKIFPRSVKLAITTNGWFSNEHFKAWVAEQGVHGAKYWGMVHGGHHGTALFNGPGKLVEIMADRFFCWGWGEDNLPSPALSMLRKRKLRAKGNSILFIAYATPKYSNHIDASPLGSTYARCLSRHRTLFDGLDNIKLLETVVVRLKGEELGWRLRDKYQSYGVRNFVGANNTTLMESLSRSRIAVIAYDSTVLLETLTLNFPTCLFLTREHWELSPSSLEVFEALVDCKVLHYDPESLVAHLDAVYADVGQWWDSEEVQVAIASFLKSFALSSSNWEKEWKAAIATAI